MKIVLVEPEIPFNTGAIGRTCVALDIELILIQPYGFKLDDKNIARAGTRYWKYVRLREYSDWNSFLTHENPPRDHLYFFEEHGAQNFYTPDYQKEAYLIFGCESKGLPSSILQDMEDRTFNLPMFSPEVKSLNLANTATAAAYQALRTHIKDHS